MNSSYLWWFLAGDKTGKMENISYIDGFE